jgi:anti-sigma factor RsiW
MTCRELTDFIMDYLAGELSRDVSSAFEEHLSLCPNCVTYLASYQATVDLSRRAFVADDADAFLRMPEELVRAILHSGKRR